MSHMVLNNPKEMDSTLKIGNTLVWAIIIVSTLTSFYYWYTISGLGDPTQTRGWMVTMVLWVAIGAGFLIDMARKVMIGAYASFKLFLLLTSISIITVLSVYMIMDDKRQATINASNGTTTTTNNIMTNARQDLSTYAYAAGFTEAGLNAEQLENTRALAGRGNGYSQTQYNSTKADIDERRKAMRAYKAADAYINGGGAAAGAGTSQQALAGTSSNPLMAIVASRLGILDKVLTIGFYTLVSVSLELVAYHVSKQMAEIKEFSTLTKLEILNKQVKSMTGHDLEVMGEDRFNKILEQQANAELMGRKKLAIKKQMAERLENQIKSKQFQGMSMQQAAQSIQTANQQLVPDQAAAALDLDGYTIKQLDDRKKDYDASNTSHTRHCPSCKGEFTPSHFQTKFCVEEHRRAYHSKIRELERSGDTSMNS